MPYIIWLFLISLIAWSYFDPRFPKWIPFLIYFIAVFVRLKEKIGNYRDWKKINERDERIKLEKTANDFGNSGLTFSGMRVQEEEKIKEDFRYERKKKMRKFWVKIIDTLFLK